MLRLGKRPILVLLAVTLVAATMPLPAPCATTAAHHDASPCGSADADARSESSHCGAGCTDCGLPCCVGTAVVLAAAPGPIAAAPILLLRHPDCSVRPQMDPAPLGRPPRA